MATPHQGTTAPLDGRLLETLSRDVALPPAQVDAALRLLVEGNTVPFVARYRKEATGGLDEVQLRAIEERHGYLAELEDRRATILAAIEEQGKLTEELRRAILACATKTALEDLYLPYRKKRRTRATIARERGLEPLALRILAQPRDGDPLREAASFVDPEREVPDGDAALAGARDIVAEAFAEDAAVRRIAREAFQRDGMLVVKAAKKDLGRTPYEQWYDYAEAIARVPSHRFLAVRRGEREDVLRVRVEVDTERLAPRLLRTAGFRSGTPFAVLFEEAARDGWRRLLAPSLETEALGEAKVRADETAVDVFQSNLRDLLLAAPLGGAPVIGVDPGLRTGCKCAAVDETGRFLGNTTIFPHGGASAERRGQAGPALLDFLRRTFPAGAGPRAVAVGNGTAGRETERFVRDTLRGAGLEDVVVVLVNEAGASVYSASDVAREEFPELDLTVRGAISIARRLQDPLAELVKIEPKAIGVGQYQHDVDQGLLQRRLDAVVESCVNAVGVELNTASAALLAYVAGLGPTRARRVVAHRDTNGPFRSRRAVLDVAGLGPKTFEQAAGFLRVRGGDHPLDASAVHPERYALVERMARDMGVPLARLVGDPTLADGVDVARYVSGEVGEPTLRDIIAELKKPGRDPRETFTPPRFREDVTSIDDLREGMELEGVVTNVTAFGAFVDVGVHRDGLVHVSQLADRFVRDPAEVVRVGETIRVRVVEVDRERDRIGLSARSPGQAGGGERNPPRGGERNAPRGGERNPPRGGERNAPRGGERNAPRGGERNAPRGGERNAPRGGDRQSPRGGFRNNPFAALLDEDRPKPPGGGGGRDH